MSHAKQASVIVLDVQQLFFKLKCKDPYGRIAKTGGRQSIPDHANTCAIIFLLKKPKLGFTTLVLVPRTGI